MFRRSAAAGLALFASACLSSPTTNSTSGVCQTSDQSCSVNADCCGGFACTGGTCQFIGNGNGASSSGGGSASASSSSGSSKSSSSSSGLASSSSGSNSSGLASSSSSSSSGVASSSSSSSSSSGTTSSSSGSSSGCFGCSSSSSSSSGLSSSSSGSACDPSGGSQEYAECSTSSDCACPYQCLTDAIYGSISGLGDTFCETPCTQGTDCPELISTCRGGACNVNLCGEADTLPDGGQNGVYSGVCSAAGNNDGSCYALYTPADGGTPASAIWVCFQAGSAPANGSCNATADATDLSGVCTAGNLCFSQDGGAAGLCQKLCNPTATSATCGNGYGCAPFDVVDDAAPDWGVCFPNGTGGSCIETGFSTEFNPCGPNAQCGCVAGADFECFNDPTLAAQIGNPYNTTTYCERSCSSTSGCPLPYSACKNSGWCTYNFCGNAGSGAGMAGLCDAAGTNDGICYPVENAAGTGPAFGVCFQDGTTAVGAACDPNSTRASDPTGACVAGAFCFANGTSNECYQLCNPDGGTAACAAAEPTCTATPDPYLGACE